MKIITNHIYPPIPDRRFDWSAVDDNYEPGCPIGYGETPAEAIADLQRLFDEMADYEQDKLLGTLA